MTNKKHTKRISRRRSLEGIVAVLEFCAVIGEKEVHVNPGDLLKTTRAIRSTRTGNILPREATFVRAVENLGRQLILVNFGSAGEEYLFPHEIVPRPPYLAGGLAEGDG
jgi:hypothetical protein